MRVARDARSTASRRSSAGGVTTFPAPAISPAYLGVGYIIGPRLAALNFAGGVVAWGLLVPLFIFFLGPHIQANDAAGHGTAIWLRSWRSGAPSSADRRWRHDGGRSYTLFRMRKSLGIGMKRAVSDLKKSARSVRGRHQPHRARPDGKLFSADSASSCSA